MDSFAEIARAIILGIYRSAKYLALSGVTGVAIVLVAGVLELIFGLFVGPNKKFLDYIVDGPTFSVPIIIGFVGGLRFGGRVRPWTGRLLWLPQLSLLVSDVITEIQLQSPGTNLRTELWNMYIGPYCAASECLGQLFFTEPFVGVLAFSLGAEFARFRARRRLIVGGAQTDIVSGMK